MTLRAELFLDLLGELDIAQTRREPHRLEIVQAAGGDAALDHVRRQPENSPFAIRRTEFMEYRQSFAAAISRNPADQPAR